MAKKKKQRSKKRSNAKRKARKKMHGTCLVLMPFKEPFDTYFVSIIKPAVAAVRLESLRGDSLFRPSPIMADIWRMIQEAKVLVADLTEKNANVFYELGLAHAIGKPVVLLADNLNDVPFDLQSLRVIIYDKNDPAWGTELKASIAASLSETLEDTVSAVPSMFRKVVRSQAPTETKTESRLDLLERQIASMATGKRDMFRTIRSPGDLFDALRMARSRSEAIALTRSALMAGLEEKIVRTVVRDALKNVPTEAKEVLAAVGLGVPKRRR
jgi:hypothetical protein